MTALMAARTRRELRREVRRFVLAGRPVPPGAAMRPAELVPALLTYLRVGRCFRRHGLAAALRLMPAVDPRRRHLDPRDDATVFCARAAGLRVQGAARTLAGEHLCLHESLALSAALRRIGFPAEVVVGYPVIEHADGHDELHAWSEVGGATVTHRIGGASLSYVEVVRYPAGPAVVPACD